jgi:hypothetical protein
MSDIFLQRICGQNPWICGLAGLGVGGIGLGTTADWVCSQNPFYCYSPPPNPDGATRSPGSGDVVKPTAPTITIYPGIVRIPVTSNPSGSVESTSTSLWSRPGEVGSNGATDSFSAEGQANIYGTIVKAVRAAKNNPYLGRLCAVGAVIGGGGLYVWESVESAKQGAEAPDPEGIINGGIDGCLFGLGVAAIIPH